jgi:heme/copper-type cytochrome/quinol oxidase subunit 2
MEFINNNANIFFFVTTILVIILIILFTILLLSAVKLYQFIAKAVKQGDAFLEEVKSNNFFKKAAPVVLPILLPIISFFAKSKKKGKK